jgi:hypothetical protein
MKPRLDGGVNAARREWARDEDRSFNAQVEQFQTL